MNEIKQVVIVNETNDYEKIVRQIKQIEQLDITDIIIIGNDIVIDDKNVSVITCSLDENKLLDVIANCVTQPFVVLYDNMLLENDLVKYILGSDFEKKNVLFTSNIEGSLYIKADEYGKIVEFVTKESTTHTYTKIFRISNIALFKDLVNNNKILHEIDKLSLQEASIEYFYFSKAKYTEETCSKIDYKKKLTDISLIDINSLKRMENFDQERALKLKEKILLDNCWLVPIIVEANYNIILDGHHRFEVAKLLNYKKIPALLVNYDDVCVWSLRNEIKVSKEKVIHKIVDNNEIYPYKTVKHKYMFQIPDINVSLESLKHD